MLGEGFRPVSTPLGKSFLSFAHEAPGRRDLQPRQGVKRGERGLAYKFRKGVCRREGKENIKDCRTWGTLDTA